MAGGVPTLKIEDRGKLTFARIHSGALAIGHRPPLRSLPRMREAGVTHIATVLSEREEPHAIETAVREAGLSWLWVELGSTKTLPARAKPEIAAALDLLSSILAAGGCVYLHCAAGIHRTGMITAALLFRLGLSEDEARAVLTALREVTAREMGQERWTWASSFARS